MLLNKERTVSRSASSEEAGVGAADAFVGVTDCAEEPLSDGLLPAVSAEEIVKDGGVEGTHGALTVVIVVSSNLGASAVVRLFNQDLDHVGVLAAELSQVLVALVESVVL